MGMLALPVYVTELPHDRLGRRNWTDWKPRVIMVEPNIGPEAFYKASQPQEFVGLKLPTIYNGEWVGVEGPCQELTEKEYVALIERAQASGHEVDQWRLVAARQRAALA